ncbi:thymidine kinase [Bacillus haynesii]|uniref:thymidine kinase n=1 Tax=Bacillus haynesii TaxID=1925021 RepID=UPI00227F6F73|nr:hypothetical protein [Bacillus haynesii]MCY8015544.1 hypothetical protein [Bacillus haynesii]MCY8291543.1 hypothetical protein [Bacillus haynesii]
MSGKLVTVVGAMGSGKTEKLIQMYRELQLNGTQTLVFKPTRDVRSGTLKVKSRNGDTAPAYSIQNIRDIYDYGGELQQVILIDEIQFFDQPDLIQALTSLCLSGIDVYCFGLDLTSDGKTFGMVGDVMAQSDEVIKLQRKCAKCHNPARISSYRGIDKTNDVKIGDLDVYEPLCRNCFFSGELKKEETINEKTEDDLLYCFHIGSKELGFRMELTVKESNLKKAGYTFEDVNDIVTLEGAYNLLDDLGLSVDSEQAGDIHE